MAVLDYRLDWPLPPKFSFDKERVMFKRVDANSLMVKEKTLTNDELVVVNGNNVQTFLNKSKKIYLSQVNPPDLGGLLNFIHDIFLPCITLSTVYSNVTFLIDEGSKEISYIPGALSFFTNFLSTYGIKYEIIKKDTTFMYANNIAIYDRSSDPIRHNIEINDRFLKKQLYTKSNKKVVFYGIWKNSTDIKDLEIIKYCNENSIDILYPEDFATYADFIKYISKVKLFITTRNDNITQSMYFAQKHACILFLQVEGSSIFRGWERFSESGKTILSTKNVEDIPKILKEKNIYGGMYA